MKKIREIVTNKWFKFGIVALLYTLWVIWLANYWWLLGLLILFDLYITKKVKWAFWKKEYKEGEKRNSLLDWIDAIIFALVAATFIRMYFFEAYVIPTSSMERSMLTGDYLFVSKVAYGPRIPQTPLSLPLVHNTLPVFNTKSYVEGIKWDYRRMAGFRSVKRDDIVVFSWPHGDTVLTKAPMEDYHYHVRLNGREYTERTLGPIIVRPVDKKDNYVKRCVAVAGDSLEIKNGQVYVNGAPQKALEGMQMTYKVITNGTPINQLTLVDKMNISPADIQFIATLPGYSDLPLTIKSLEQIKELTNVISVEQNNSVYPPDFPDSPITVFPFTPYNQWTRDNFGPLWIPKKGATVSLTADNLPLYRRIIAVYEGNELTVKEGQCYINGQPSNSYTFKMDYYFMMGDNRHNSLDSRYWGFVPEDHVVGKPAVVWFSTDKYKSFPKNIRWGRIFKFL